ncbi:hypothetical protein BC830DRAFT_1078100 [Chytriomyces sp. MP71]|nr:hypothetical protein BC830DRAFT_1078100 [Chytriomyces sp. MP71]
MPDDHERRPRPPPNRTLFDPSAVGGSSSSSSSKKPRERERVERADMGEKGEKEKRRVRRDKDKDKKHGETLVAAVSSVAKPVLSGVVRIEKRSSALTPVSNPAAAIPSLPQPPVPIPHSQPVDKPVLLARPSNNAASQIHSEKLSFKFIADASTTHANMKVVTLPDALPGTVLADAPGCFIIGVVGRKGVGKSTILNLFASPVSSNLVSRTSSSSSKPFNTKATTRGIDVHSTGDGLVLLDTQQIAFPSAAIKKSRRNAPPPEETATAVRQSEKMTLLLYSICHILLVVSSGNSTRDEEMWAFLRRMEAIKYRAEGGIEPVDEELEQFAPGRRTRQRQGKRNRKAGKENLVSVVDHEEADDDEDEAESGHSSQEENTDSHDSEHNPTPRNAKRSRSKPRARTESGPQPTNENKDPDIFFPDLIFIHNRAKPSDFGTNNHASTAAALSRAFRDSRLRITSGILHMGMPFPQLYPPVEKYPAPNFWLLPTVPAIPSLHALPAESESTSLLDRLSAHLAIGGDVPARAGSYLKDAEGVPARYAVLCDLMRDAVCEVPRYPFALPPPLQSPFRAESAGEGDGRGAGTGGTLVPGRNRFQVSEREWYKSAVGIWSRLVE